MLVKCCSRLAFRFSPGPQTICWRTHITTTDNGLDETAWLLKVPFYYITIANKNLEAAFTLMELKGEDGKLPGVIIQPEIPEEFPLKFHIAPTIDLRLLAGTNAASQFGILLRPGEASIQYPFQPGTAPPAAGIGIGFDFTPADTDVAVRRSGCDAAGVPGRRHRLRREDPAKARWMFC